MAITSARSNAGSSVSSVTVTNVAPSGSNRVLYVAVATRPYTTTVSSVAFNTSESLSFVDARNVTSGDTFRLEVWRLIAPTATTASVVATLSTGSTTCLVMCICASDVNQVTPNDSTVKDGGASITNAALAGELAWGGGSDLQLIFASNRDTNKTFTVDGGVTAVTSGTATSGSGSTHLRIVTVTDAETETGKVIGALSAAGAVNVIGMNLNAAGTSSIAPISAGHMLRGMR